MKAFYFVDKDRVRQGPFSIDELRNQEILPTSLVWYKGMEKWQKAEDVPDLADLFSGTTENSDTEGENNEGDSISNDSNELNETSVTEESAISDSKEANAYRASSYIQEESHSNNKAIIVIALLAVIAIGAVGFYAYYDSQQTELRNQYEEQLYLERQKVTNEQNRAEESRAAQAVAEQEKRNLEADLERAKKEAQETSSSSSSSYNYGSSSSSYGSSSSSYNSNSYSSSSYCPSRVRVTGVHVRLRTSPTTNSNYNIVTYTNGQPVYPDKGEVLECVGQASDFYKVRYLGYTYYISKQFTEPY